MKFSQASDHLALRKAADSLKALATGRSEVVLQVRVLPGMQLSILRNGPVRGSEVSSKVVNVLISAKAVSGQRWPFDASLPIDTLYVSRYYSYRISIGEAA
jgi:hypothetical protein